MKRYSHSEGIPIPIWEGQPRFARADIELHGLSHRHDTYEGRVYLNNARASARTAPEARNGYAGSFFVFGHGPCYGDEGHCNLDPGPIHPFDYRRPDPLTAQVAVVNVTQRLLKLIDAGATELTVTIVPVDGAGKAAGDVLEFERLSLITYD
jgi:hypothetical protein